MDIFDLQKEYVTTLIHDTIETYPGPWRLVHEGSQNAADAIQRNSKIKAGKIEIELHVGTNRVVIIDNGGGIPIAKFASIFQLGGGDKRDGELRKLLKGSQGVGIKATCYTSTSFAVQTVHDGAKWNYEAKGLDKFAEPSFRSEIVSPVSSPTKEPSGTTIEYTLANYSVLDFLNEVVAEYLEDSQLDEVGNADQLKVAIEQYFRTKTYLGCVLRLLGTSSALKPIRVEIRIVFDYTSIADHKKIEANGWAFVAATEHHGHTISHQFPGTYLDAAAIHAALPKSAKADKLYTHFEEVLITPPDPTLRKILIQKFDTEAVERLLYKTKRDPDTNAILLEKDNESIRRHQRALGYVNGMYLVISQRNYMGKYLHLGPRQILSVNGLPTNIALSTPRGALAYLNNIHLVMDVDCTLGFGKRNIPGRTKGIIDALFADIWSMLRRICPPIVGVKEGKDPTDFETWDKEAEYDAFADGSNTFRELPLSLKITPKTEQEVAALFFELIGRKIVQGYFPFRTGGSRTLYDGLFFIDSAGGDKLPKKFKPRELKTLEFKYHLSEIISDFDEQIKYLDDIDVVVCWDDDTEPDTMEYNVHSLEREGIDPLPGATMRIQKGTQSCQVIVLKDLIESLEFGPAE